MEPSSAAIDYLSSFNLQLGDYDFGSTMVGLEYGFLGDMVQTQSDPPNMLDWTSPNQFNISYHPMTNLAAAGSSSGPTQPPSAAMMQQQQQQQSLLPVSAPPAATLTAASSSHTTASSAAQATRANNHSTSDVHANAAPVFATMVSPTSMTSNAPSSSPSAHAPTSTGAGKDANTSSNSNSGSNVRTNASASSIMPSTSTHDAPTTGNHQNTSTSPHTTTVTPIPTKRSLYRAAKIEKPFNYAEGFHYLIQYVRKNMDRGDLMRISRALAKFRPSFLVLIMNLTEEDLIFMEKCIQRTLLEYEKLVNFSGTPTAVWRRTGEICLLGKEFCLLTQWTKEMILSKKKYIYELMDCASAVEYWENFSKHAFDNTDTSRYYSCILQSPQNKPIPCTFCFMIKRDIFDLPSVIVGNFLPILG
ncbi:hypothetical protein BC940DRAFT_309747 [Gongronella butleri]|nr:hypothetical protein BC940DRAFT_309747 [Gongronella butleri]